MKFIYNQGPISVFKHPKKGFCVIAAVDLKAGDLLCSSVVARIGFKDLKSHSAFNDYPMYWDKKSDCIAFGPINLLNHSKKTTARLVRDRKLSLITMYAKRDLQAGEELTISYGCKLWFDILE